MFKSSVFLLLSIWSLISVKGQVKSTLSNAKYGFENPQDSTRTKVWWFHGETETTKEGITADLEAFKNAGIGGVVYYDQSHGKAEKALPGFSTDWWEMLKFAALEANRIGLTFEMHISNGYVAGGKWITNENSMKRLTATEMIINGGTKFTGKLSEPINKYNYFKDVAVLAFPIHQGAGKTSSSELVEITSTEKIIDTEQLFNTNSNYAVRIPKNNKGIFINLKFKEEFEARSITYKMQPRGKATTSATNVPGPPSETFTGTGYRVLPDFGDLEVSDDGINYKKVCALKPIYRAHESWRQKTISFTAVRGKFYRIHLHDWWEDSEKNKELLLNSIILNSSAKVDQFEEKAGLFTEYIEGDKTPNYNGGEVINSKEIINLTNNLNSEGILSWNPPKGKWMIMRFVSEPTGATTKHGRANLIGKECDKLSKAAAELHWNNYVGIIADSLKKTKGINLTGIAMDRHEAGSQNWTDTFLDEFSKRRGYDLIKKLPVMMGYIVDGVKESNDILYDIRRNIADMISDNYYGTFNELAKKRGLSFTAQAIGNALCIVGDPIQAKSKVDKPQGEFWVIHPDGNYDIKESSSAAHLYGKPIASAEAFTDALYSTSLAELKSLADYAYSYGINEFVICASAYQPWIDRIPGSTGGGRQYAINRNNTWWNYSRPFWDYQSRSAFLMRMGKSVADICVFLGDNAPVKILTHRLPDIPGGYDFDAFSTDALLSRMDGAEGKISLPDGISYRMMVLPRNSDITLKALEKISEIVEKGGNIFGLKPLQSNSAEDIGKEKRYKELADKLWGKNPLEKGVNQYGKGKVYWGETLESSLKKAKLLPDLILEKSNTKESKIYFAHRKIADAHIYFIHNHKDIMENNTFTFSAKGHYPQIWNPATGKRYNISSEKISGSTTSLKLSLPARESLFIVISDLYEELPLYQNSPSDSVKNLDENWKVYFDEKLGGVGSVIFDKLMDWTEFSDPKIKYYSGTAVYTKEINIISNNKKVVIDLDNPGFVASVSVNKKNAGIVWCSPWQLDITPFLKNGKNKIEIKVANSLMNRMIYDSRLPIKDRKTYSFPEIVTASDKLEKSGLTNVKLLIKEK